ncbi:MAG: methionine gamma-lyase family protein [Clostridia bacterium]|nr:methionine gamma-lyase family protein [Clostridia bacterium]
MQISESVRALALRAEAEMAELFCDIDEIARVGTEKVLDVFREERVSESMFAPSTGYGYGDSGRDAVDRIATKIFGAEAGFMRPSIQSGTHALTIGLFALLRPGDVMLSVTGSPYDTLREVIGMDGANGDGSLADFGVRYDDVDFTSAWKIDFAGIEAKMQAHGDALKVVFIQRSKGYLNRPTLTVSEIGEIAKFVKARAKHDVYVVVDNCYGEFTETSEPCAVGADLIIGSLIKNAGGGMADIGGYLCGTPRAVELAGNRLICPGVGLDAGASLGQNRNMLRGLFYAPHTVAQAMKTAHLAAYMFEACGFDVSPRAFERRSDIIQTVSLGNRDALCAFCRGIQSASPVDSHVTPEPWAMPGYADEVIMAAGAFVGGASIELSADAPLRDPFTVFLQGGLTYESGRLGIMAACEAVTAQK